MVEDEKEKYQHDYAFYAMLGFEFSLWICTIRQTLETKHWLACGSSSSLWAAHFHLLGRVAQKYILICLHELLVLKTIFSRSKKGPAGE